MHACTPWFETHVALLQHDSRVPQVAQPSQHPQALLKLLLQHESLRSLDLSSDIVLHLDDALMMHEPLQLVSSVMGTAPQHQSTFEQAQPARRRSWTWKLSVNSHVCCVAPSWASREEVVNSGCSICAEPAAEILLQARIHFQPRITDQMIESCGKV
jgi:hypothetical protein